VFYVPNIVVITVLDQCGPFSVYSRTICTGPMWSTQNRTGRTSGRGYVPKPEVALKPLLVLLTSEFSSNFYHLDVVFSTS
jgi:hypothetical protein